MNKIEKFLKNIDKRIKPKDTYPKVILIGGKAGHGKDTLASYLKKEFESKKISVLILHNADYLKYIASAYLDWNGEKTPINREMLQKLGTDKFRVQMMRENIWADYTRDIIIALSGVYDIFIVADIRFQTELIHFNNSFRNRTTAIYISRPNFDNNLNEEAKNHISETDFDNGKYDFQYFIENKSLDDLEKQAKELARII